MGPLEGHNLELWEGGIKVPALVRWPGKIKPNTTTDQVAVTNDLKKPGARHVSKAEVRI